MLRETALVGESRGLNRQDDAFIMVPISRGSIAANRVAPRVYSSLALLGTFIFFGGGIHD